MRTAQSNIHQVITPAQSLSLNTVLGLLLGCAKLVWFCYKFISLIPDNSLETKTSRENKNAIWKTYNQGYHTVLPSLFLGFVLILQYYVVENITVLISKKCPYL